jgi:hypothetical protein
MDLAADTAKIILAQEKQAPANLRAVPEPSMADVAESVSELDEEAMEND